MINLELTHEEARFLLNELGRERGHVENELVHTDKHSMQAELAGDLKNLEQLVARLARAVELSKTDPVA